MDESTKKRFNICIVDDSDFSRKNISTILEEEGFNIVGECSSAEDAMKLTQQSAIHCYIIDVVMPEVSGMELLSWLNEITVPKTILLMSSLNSEQIVIDSISKGAHDFLRKPFEKYELVKSVTKLAQIAKKERIL